MKKIIALFTLLTIWVSNFNAQNIQNVQNNQTDQSNEPITVEDTREKLHIGAKIGVNYSNVYDAKGEQFNADSKLGLVVGGFVSIPIGKYLGFQPELLFSQKGFKGDGTILGMPYEFTRTTNYIDIPLLFQIKPSEYMSVVIGPQYSYLIKQSDTFNNSSVEQEFENDNIRKNMLCFIGGLDFNVSDYAVIGVRVGWDVQENNGDGTSDTPRYKNIWYQATLGFRL